MMRIICRLGAFLFAFVVTGCSDDGGGSGEPVTLTLTVHEFIANQDYPPVPGVEVCVQGTSDCATTDDDGVVVLELPANDEAALTLTGEGYQRGLTALTTEAVAIEGEMLVLSETTAQSLSGVLGIAYPLQETGAFSLGVVTDPPTLGEDGIAGVTMTLSEPQGQRYYIGASGIPSTELTSTTEPLGSGGYVELPTGTYDVELGGTASNCEVLAAWPGGRDNSFRLPVEAGYLTFAFVTCDPVSTVQLDLQVIEFEPGASMDPPLEGAEVCVADTSNCNTSDSEGMVMLDVPANSELELLVTAEGYGPTLTPLTTSEDDVDGQVTPLLTDEVLTVLAGALGTPYPPGGDGLIAVSVLTEPITAQDNGIAGVTLTPDSSATVYYLDENEIPRTDIGATTEPSGAGGLIEVAPGTWELTLGGTASNCAVVSGWPGSDSTTVRLPVRAGHITQGFVTCQPVP